VSFWENTVAIHVTGFSSIPNNAERMSNFKRQAKNHVIFVGFNNNVAINERGYRTSGFSYPIL
jgi:hypothetical protein